MMRKKCQETTHRLNCGCCDEVRLDCNRPAGHKGRHKGTTTEWDHLVVTWEYESGWTHDGYDSTHAVEVGQ